MSFSSFFRLVFFGVIGAVIVVASTMIFTGCKGGSHSFREDQGNLYLKNCRVETREDGSHVLLADVSLPLDYIGLLYAEGNTFSETVVFDSGTVQISVLPPDATGIYEFCLKFIRKFEVEINRQNRFLIKDLTNVVECCLFDLGGEVEIPDEEDPVEDPKLVCNVNLGGHLSIVINLGTFDSAWLECDSLYSGPVLISFNQTIVETHVVPGTYVFRLILGDIVVECTVEVPENEEHDPNGPKKRYWVCFQGHSIYLPETAYLRHLELGATPGPCDDDHDDDDDD